MTEINIQPEDQAVFNRLKSTGRITHGLRRAMTQRWNKCAICDLAVSPGRPAFAGYGVNDAPLLVGSCCARQLAELATPVYWTDSLNLSIDDEQRVWRFMDFAKFVAMLRQRGLYFARADKLEDRFEAAVGLANREPDWDRHYLHFFREAVTTAPPGYAPPKLGTDEIEDTAKRLLKDLKSISSEARSMLVNCWHANDIESEALWRLYCPSGTSGVAIRTTVGKLWDLCAPDAKAIVGRVHYKDFRRSFAPHNPIERIYCKRQSLSHENEVRIVLANERRNPLPGKILPCDLTVLIDEVVVSPFAAPWLAEVVSNVISKFGYAFGARPSELLDEPFY